MLDDLGRARAGGSRIVQEEDEEEERMQRIADLIYGKRG